MNVKIFDDKTVLGMEAAKAGACADTGGKLDPAK